MLILVDLTGHDSNFSASLSRLQEAIDALPPGPPAPRVRPEPSRREWGSVGEAVTSVMATGLPLRVEDIHEAVEIQLGEPVSRSSIKNCLAKNTSGRDGEFVRVKRGWYLLGNQQHPS